MSMKLFNTHIHAHTEHKAGSGPLTSPAVSMSLLNINKSIGPEKKGKFMKRQKREHILDSGNIGCILNFKRPLKKLKIMKSLEE